MDFQEFIKRLSILNWGVVSFNTYKQNDENMCYLMIAEKGDFGKFQKGECKASNLNSSLDIIYRELKRMVDT